MPGDPMEPDGTRQQALPFFMYTIQKKINRLQRLLRKKYTITVNNVTETHTRKLSRKVMN